ncbi:MAG: acylphosphatase [Candidatus Aenigmarchaeota archaeon]|nr:acylphosphatase [Candidatus Aenigmarchaeota archaeon]
MMMKRIRIYVHGKVQGVFYRHNTKKIADSLNIKGWVRNKEDGSVEILAEGPDVNLKKFIEWCKVGPPMARVERLDVIEEKNTTKKLSDFEIIW